VDVLYERVVSICILFFPTQPAPAEMTEEILQKVGVLLDLMLSCSLPV